jgi:hypothetical protein
MQLGKPRVEEQVEDAKTNLNMFQPDFVDTLLSTLNPGEIRILNECWEQLKTDLMRYEPSTVSIPLFLFHFHNYAS